MNREFDVKGRVHTLQQRTPPIVIITGRENWPNRETFDVEFSPSGKLLQVAEYNCAGMVMSFERYDYDDSGKALRCTCLDGSGAEIDRTEFTHEEGRDVDLTRNSSGALVGRAITVYENGHIVSYSTFGAQGQQKTEKTFQYVENRLSKSVSRYFSPNGTLGEQWISTYDLDERLAETFGLTADGSPLGDGKYRYEYGVEGRLIRVWGFNDFGDDNVANSLKIYEYYSFDEHGNWGERRAFHQFRSDSKWSKRVTVRKLTYFPPDGSNA